MQEPLAIIDAVAVVAIDPYRFAARALGNEIIAAHVGAIPPAGFDPFGTVAQDPRLRFQHLTERRRLGEQPDGSRRKGVGGQ